MTAFKAAREAADLTVRQAAALCRVGEVTIRRWEMRPGQKTARNAPPLAIAVLEWFKDGSAPTIPSNE